MTRGDVETLRAAGFSDTAIHDIVQITGFFAYYNRLADGLGIDPEGRRYGRITTLSASRRRMLRRAASSSARGRSAERRASRVERAARQEVQGAPEGRRAVVVGAFHRDLRVVEAVGVERDGGARRAAAEELDQAAGADRGEGVLPGGGGAGGLDGDVEAVAGARAAAEAGRLAAVAAHLDGGVRAERRGPSPGAGVGIRQHDVVIAAGREVGGGVGEHVHEQQADRAAAVDHDLRGPLQRPRSRGRAARRRAARRGRRSRTAGSAGSG